MATIRLTSGSDLEVKYSVKELLEILSTLSQPQGYVELPGPEGPLYVRPAEVIAIMPEVPRRGTGFRVDGSTSSKGK